MTSNVESTQIIINSFDSKDNWFPTFEVLTYPYLELGSLSIENKRPTIQFVIAEVAKRIQLNLEPTVASVIAKPVEIAYATLGPTVPF